VYICEAAQEVSPETHLLASWVIGAKTTDNARDCRLVALAGILPDCDGLGLIVDMVNQAFGGKRTFFYLRYHHVLLHGAFGAILITLLVTAFARRKWRVALLALLVVHLHLLCDLVGSRGPDPVDLWPIFYFGPFTKDQMWIWKGQWPLDAWPNRLLSVVLLLWAFWLAVPLGYSFVGVFSQRADRVFVGVLRKWYGDLMGYFRITPSATASSNSPTSAASESLTKSVPTTVSRPRGLKESSRDSECSEDPL
jgi:inner membrane protein